MHDGPAINRIDTTMLRFGLISNCAIIALILGLAVPCAASANPAPAAEATAPAVTASPHATDALKAQIPARIRLAQSQGGYLPPGYGTPPQRSDPYAEPPRQIAPRRSEPQDIYPQSPPPGPRAHDGRDDYGAGGEARRPYGGVYPPPYEDRTYSSNEILDAGHRFFGTVSKGLARVIEHAFARQGRPNGYILGEEAGGAIVAGLRYGEGLLYTKYNGVHKVYWQGPSIGYDFGGEGSKTLILVYNLDYPDQIFHRFAGIDGSAYLVGGVGITFQKHGDVVLAPIRSGVGLRFGANVGYLKYTPYPTWNPF
jgi:hypothetical protein